MLKFIFLLPQLNDVAIQRFDDKMSAGGVNHETLTTLTRSPWGRVEQKHILEVFRKRIVPYLSIISKSPGYLLILVDVIEKVQSTPGKYITIVLYPKRPQQFRLQEFVFQVYSEAPGIFLQAKSLYRPRFSLRLTCAVKPVGDCHKPSAVILQSDAEKLSLGCWNLSAMDDYVFSATLSCPT